MEEKLARMKELIDVLNNASIMYYQESKPVMSDYEYDKLYDDLVLLEQETNTVLSNSPTINVEPDSVTSLKKVEHPKPMLSLAKTKNVSDLESFLGDENGLLSWKLDGLTIVLTYENGLLTTGVTRGNGVVGEIVTDNVRRFKNIPLSIPFKEKLVIRGEAVIKYSDFEKMNGELGDDENTYKNPRNLCSGSVRQLDSNITAKRNVNCIIFALIEAGHTTFKKREEEFSFLKENGFQTVDYVLVTKNNIALEVENYKKKIQTFDIPSDGLVLTFNDIEYANKLGSTAKYPKHSIAFKWKDETAKTKLLSVDWMVSRTGLINPVAVFNPVELEGTIVSRASIHNISIIKKLELGINDEILVYKANMIIPQIADNLTRSNNLLIPNTCPRCGYKAEIKKENDSESLYCLNEFCVSKLIKKLSLFCSRNGMNIEGLSDAILERFIDEKIIYDYYSIYHLDNYKEEIITLDGFGEKSYLNLIDSINKSRKVKLANFIYALGIPDVGLSRAKLICNHYHNNFNDIRNASLDELGSIIGVGEIIAKNIIDYFNNEQIKSEISNLLKEIQFADATLKTAKLANLSFVITGSLNHFDNRDDLVDFIEKNGGKKVASVSKNTDYLINNDVNSTSQKNQKAKELGVKIITEEDFLNMIGEANE